MMNWISFSPELYTVLMAGCFLFLSLARPNVRRDHQTALLLAALGLIVCVAAVSQKATLFAGTYQVDLFSQVFKTLVFMGFFLVICLCGDLGGVAEERHSEFYLLLSISTLAMMMLASCVHLLTIYIALELSSFSLYILVYLRRQEEKGFETGLKYFIIGATSSALMLFGFAMLYGAGHSGYLSDLARTIPNHLSSPFVLIAFVLSLSGFFFKLALFPFHFWAPDVYEGAPHQVAAYIATASKVAAIAILLRMTALSGGVSDHLAYFLIVLCIASMTIGNLSAIAQKDFKRLLAFSSIAHAGYVMIGILCLNAMGFSSAIFYAFSLMIMKFTCFLVVVKVAADGRNIDISQLAGLHRRAPVLALALMLALFGLAGIPPTIGFTSKLLIFMAAIGKGYFFLAVIAMFNVVISLYYYLHVLKAAYFTPDNNAPAIAVSIPLKLLTVGLIFLMVAGGLYPRFMVTIADAMTRALMQLP